MEPPWIMRNVLCVEPVHTCPGHHSDDRPKAQPHGEACRPKAQPHGEALPLMHMGMEARSIARSRHSLAVTTHASLPS